MKVLNYLVNGFYIYGGKIKYKQPIFAPMIEILSRKIEERKIAGSLPDIDIDHQHDRRDEVKDYLTQRYGKHQCCSAGTYVTLQLKAAIQDLCRVYNVSIASARYLTAILDKDIETWEDFIRLASANERVGAFVKKYPYLVNDLRLVIGTIKAKSSHASAFIIFPEDKEAYNHTPIRKEYKDDKEILVSGLDGYELEECGFLKQDILSLKQLTKLQQTIKLINENEDETLTFENMPFGDKKVYEYLSKGWNQDVFQFGTKGLLEYCTQLKPDNLNDLIAAVALYRPGTMENNFHNKYIARKEGREEVETFSGCEEILKDTYGLMVYQEQISLICQKLADFDAETSDSVRKSLGKKVLEILEKLKDEFISKSTKNGYDKGEMLELWGAMEKFASYSFNYSHSVAYARLGYKSQWPKVNFPIYFWVTAFSNVTETTKDEKIPNYISEINKTGDIRVLPPDINVSSNDFTYNLKQSKIFYSLTSIKQCGDKAMEQLVNDKKEKGEYFSLSEFLSRNVYKGSKVNKSTVENLIMSGAFDEVEGIQNPKERYELIKEYRKECNVKIKKTDTCIFRDNPDKVDYNWWWMLQQKKLCGYGMFDFKTICDNYLDAPHPFFIGNDIDTVEDGEKIQTAGIVTSVDVKKGKKGEYANLVIESNFEFNFVRIWYDEFERFKEQIDECKNNLILLTGRVKMDSFKKKKIIILYEQSEFLILE